MKYTALQQKILKTRLSDEEIEGFDNNESVLLDAGVAFSKEPVAITAAGLVKSYVNSNKVIYLITDTDADGSLSNALITHCLIDIFGVCPSRVVAVHGDRLEHGYGMQLSLIKDLLTQKPSLIITADLGSSDGVAIKELLFRGFDVIVTDHHLLPEKGTVKHPSGAIIINPQQGDSSLDKRIPGVLVAYFLMEACSKVLGCGENLIKRTLDFVAVGVVSDYCSMKSSINRHVYRLGRQLMVDGGRSCWRALDLIPSDALSFQLIPAINAAGRAGCPYLAVKFLLARSVGEAHILLVKLQELNNKRKLLQKKAITSTRKELEAQVTKKQAVILHLDKDYQGIMGLLAGKVSRDWNIPVLARNDKNGSLRSPPWCDLSKVFLNNWEGIAEFGGHKQAGGLRIVAGELVDELFVGECQKQLSKRYNNKIKYDAIATLTECWGYLLGEVCALAPYGPEFSEPIILIMNLTIEKLRVSSDGCHAFLSFFDEFGEKMFGNYFFFRPSKKHKMTFKVGDVVSVYVAALSFKEIEQRVLGVSFVD